MFCIVQQHFILILESKIISTTKHFIQQNIPQVEYSEDVRKIELPSIDIFSSFDLYHRCFTPPQHTQSTFPFFSHYEPETSPTSIQSHSRHCQI